MMNTRNNNNNNNNDGGLNSIIQLMIYLLQNVTELVTLSLQVSQN